MYLINFSFRFFSAALFWQLTALIELNQSNNQTLEEYAVDATQTKKKKTLWWPTLMINEADLFTLSHSVAYTVPNLTVPSLPLAFIKY